MLWYRKRKSAIIISSFNRNRIIFLIGNKGRKLVHLLVHGVILIQVCHKNQSLVFFFLIFSQIIYFSQMSIALRMITVAKIQSTYFQVLNMILETCWIGLKLILGRLIRVKFMVLGVKNMTPFRLTVNGKIIPCSNEVKLLVITINNELKFKKAYRRSF